MRTTTLAITSAIVLGLLLPAGSHAAPVVPAPVTGGSDVVPVAKKRKKVASRDPVLLGRVEDIDRRERNAKNRRGGKLMGRAPAKRRTQGNSAMDQFMQGMALGAVQALTGVGSGGCGIDVTTPNPTGCGTRMGGGGGNNGLRPPYYCLVNGRKIVTNTFRSGCWMVSQDNSRLR